MILAVVEKLLCQSEIFDIEEVLIHSVLKKRLRPLIWLQCKNMRVHQILKWHNHTYMFSIAKKFRLHDQLDHASREDH